MMVECKFDKQHDLYEFFKDGRCICHVTGNAVHSLPLAEQIMFIANIKKSFTFSEE